MEGDEEAILDWINTFENIPKCHSFNNLSSGHIICLMLLEIDPVYFGELESVNDTSDNWALSSRNLKKILRKLEDYFKDIHQKGIDISTIDIDSIARNSNVEAITNFLELVIGVAVLCENKANFIQRIFSLHQSSQEVLKGMVERAMHRTWDLHGEGEEEGGNGSDQGEDAAYLSAQLRQAHDLLAAQTSELEELRATFAEVVANNSTLKAEIETLKEAEFRRDVNKDSDRSRAEAAANVQSHMKVQIEELRAQVSKLNADLENYKYENQSLTKRLEDNEEIRTRLEVEALQMADELDVARDKAQKLTKAEGTIEKYQKKLEAMTALKNENKQLEETIDKYLEQIHELEAAKNSAASTAKLIEKYKDKSVVLERERFEATTALEMKEEELRRLQRDLEDAIEGKKFIEDEVTALRQQVELLQNAESERSSGFGVFDESPAVLKEKIRKLEVEIRVLKKNEAAGGSVNVTHISTDNNSANSSYIRELEEKIQQLESDMEILQASKKEREDSLIATKKQLSEAQSDLKKAWASLEDAEKSESRNSIKVDKYREMEQQLKLKAETLTHMENRWKESESKLAKMEHDKEKLENFAKKSLANFKDKYLAIIQKNKSDKSVLEQKLNAMTEKYEKEQERFRREERLILSAMYEVGVQTMERNINLQIHESASSSNTFLASQRADQDRRLGAGATSLSNSQHGTPMTPVR